jgi:hypothetical protein
MLFFDLLYFNIYRWYSQIKNGKAEGGSSCFLVSGLQLFNILSAILFYDAIRNLSIQISNLLIVLLYFCLFLINYFRYIYFETVQVRVKDIWEFKTIENKKLLIRLFVLYIVVSCLLFFGLIFFFATK